MKDEFNRLKMKIILRIAIMAGVALCLGFVILNVLIDGILEAPFAEAFTNLVMSLFKIDYYTAANIYFAIFQEHKTLVLAFGFILLLFILFYFALRHFTRYFKEISNGLNVLIEETEPYISFSPELDFMEKKFNWVKSEMATRKKAASESEERKNELVVYLAHDIKTPLTSMIGYLTLLNEAADMPREQREKYMRIALDKGFRLEKLIDEFFDITRFNLHTILLDQEEIDLNFMLRQVADEFYPLLVPEHKKAEVYGDEDVAIKGDRDKLARVFNNILKNAVAYSDEGGIIRIDIRKEEAGVTVIFTNQGKTIPAHKLETIFEKFYRLDNARSSHTGGAGLGLAIAREIVLAHGGEITAKSQDGETSFVIFFPN